MASRVSNTEWGLLIGAAGMVDLFQLVLDVLGQIGVLANRFIDIAMGMALPFYLHMRGVKLDSKKVASMAVSFLLEEVPEVDALPLWCADVIAIMFWDKADQALEKVTQPPGEVVPFKPRSTGQPRKGGSSTEEGRRAA